MKKLILASASPRRRELLQLLALPYEVIPADVSEAPTPEIASAREWAQALAWAKAEAVAAGQGPEALVIGADTIVAVEEEILGKPADDEEALRMLLRLQGRTHQVITGLAILPGWRAGAPHRRDEGRSDAVVTDVTFRPATRRELENYVRTGEPRDKAGAYAIQGRGSVFITGIRGCYFNVVGLPVARLAAMLEEFGVRVF